MPPQRRAPGAKLHKNSGAATERGGSLRRRPIYQPGPRGPFRKLRKMSTWLLFLCQFSIIAFALVGGVFLAFSDFIMRSLDTANSPGGIEVMQVINREVFKWVFMTLFMGMAAVSIVIIGYTQRSITHG